MGKEFRFESAIFANSRTVGKDCRRLFWVGEIAMEKNEALKMVGKYLLSGEQETAKTLINEQYPFRHILDAICLAVTANLDAQGRTEIIPENPSTDDKGLKMQMVIPKG